MEGEEKGASQQCKKYRECEDITVEMENDFNMNLKQQKSAWYKAKKRARGGESIQAATGFEAEHLGIGCMPPPQCRYSSEHSVSPTPHASRRRSSSVLSPTPQATQHRSSSELSPTPQATRRQSSSELSPTSQATWR